MTTMLRTLVLKRVGLAWRASEKVESDARESSVTECASENSNSPRMFATCEVQIVVKAHRLVYPPTLGLRVIKKKKGYT